MHSNVISGCRTDATSTPGIGGTLRTVPEDFIVDEIPLAGKGKTTGPYLICRLTKTNWELQHAVKEIARRLNISHRRIGWAGTKDRNARTTQLISLYKVTPEDIAAFYLRTSPLNRSGSQTNSSRLGILRETGSLSVSGMPTRRICRPGRCRNRGRIAGPAQLFRAPAVRGHPPADAPDRGADPPWRLRAGGGHLCGPGIPSRD